MKKRTPKKKALSLSKFTEARMGQALVKAYGVIETAAEGLGCSKNTVYEYLKRYPALKDVLSEAREGALDLAESRLIKAIEADNLVAIIFFLKTQGKHRGYVERSEHDVSLRGDVTLRVVYDA